TVALFGDAPCPIDLSGLVTSGDAPEVSAGGARLPETAGFINGSGKSSRGLNTDTGDGHQLPTGLGSVGDLTQHQIHFLDLLHQPSSHGKQRGDAVAEAGYVGGLHYAVDKGLALTGAGLEAEGRAQA